MAKECNEKVYGCWRVFIGLPHCHQLPVTRTSSKGDDFDWMREQFLVLYYLNAVQSVSAKI